ARSEKEEHHQYLHTVVEHVSAGLLSFDQEGNVGLINATAKKLLNIGPLRNMDDLIETNSRLYKAMFDLPPGKSTLHRTSDDIQLSIHATEIKLGVNKFKLVAIQNIQPELQKKELEAWQNLTRVLRHEIMNSITPIASLTSTMRDILKEEVHIDKHICTLEIEAMDDLKEGIDTIEGRSTGLIKFIDAYRDYTSIPLPRFKEIKARDLMKHVVKLMKTELKKEDIQCTVMIDPEELTITADEEQMEQVLINIMKNAIEALKGRSGAYIVLSGGKNKEEGPWLQVTDNGPGIIREALQKIFIPFYSTKNRGSGIGLALSRQIMQLHHGTLTVESEPDDYTKFTLRF
ncbi:MAG: ATP-binding protein, partial [Cyclobacteriaceae bacterium]|nr:ATP-binding protein [Cyclobacteriaceae bacterium]